MRIDVVSGFLGSGKTTFINKILPYCEGKVAIIENEYGETSIDGALIEGNLPVTEITAGCICCSLVGDFKKTIKALDEQWQPDRVMIEPSGVSCFSDVLRACSEVRAELGDKVQLGRLITLVEAEGFEDYMEVFGAFYSDQIQNANAILLSHTQEMDSANLEKVVAGIREINPQAAIWSQDWRDLDGSVLFDWVDGVGQDGSFAVEGEDRLLLNAKDTFGSCSFISPVEWGEDELEAFLEELGSGAFGRVIRSKGFFAGPEGRVLHFDFTPYNHKIEVQEELPKVALGTAVFIGCALERDAIQARVMG